MQNSFGNNPTTRRHTSNNSTIKNFLFDIIGIIKNFPFFMRDVFRDEVFTSKNLFLNMLNNTVFIYILVAFFLVIITGTFLEVILEKAELIKLYADEDPVFKQEILNKINADYEETIALGKADEKRRNEQNTRLIWNELAPYLISLVVITLIFGMFSAAPWGESKYSRKADSFLIFTLLFAFSTEIVFYFVVLRNWVYIGDQELLTRLII